MYVTHFHGVFVIVASSLNFFLTQYFRNESGSGCSVIEVVTWISVASLAKVSASPLPLTPVCPLTQEFFFRLIQESQWQSEGIYVEFMFSNAFNLYRLYKYKRNSSYGENCVQMMAYYYHYSFSKKLRPYFLEVKREAQPSCLPKYLPFIIFTIICKYISFLQTK